MKNKGEAKIRAFAASDRAALIALFKLNSPRYFAQEELKDFQQYLTNEREDYFVITQALEIVGCGGINYERDHQLAIISWDMIHPQYHGIGLGSQLLQHRLAIIKKDKSIAHVIVRTSQHTYIFYEKNGFTTEKVVKDYWAKGFDLYKMAYRDS